MKNTFLFLLLCWIPFLIALAPNDQVPAFSAKNQDGKSVHLSDFKGKFLLLYFYPKDDTPGCTTEANNFRDKFEKMKKMNAMVIGVSRQDEKSHREFRAKHNLPFDLLVDADGSLAKLFGVGKMPILGFSKRQSVLIGPAGELLRFYDSVDPATHADAVMKDIESLSKSSAPVLSK